MDNIIKDGHSFLCLLAFASIGIWIVFRFELFVNPNDHLFMYGTRAIIKMAHLFL